MKKLVIKSPMDDTRYDREDPPAMGKARKMVRKAMRKRSRSMS